MWFTPSFYSAWPLAGMANIQFGLIDTEGPEVPTDREYTAVQKLREKSALVRSGRANRQRGHHPNVILTESVYEVLTTPPK